MLNEALVKKEKKKKKKKKGKNLYVSSLVMMFERQLTSHTLGWARSTSAVAVPSAPAPTYSTTYNYES